MNKINPASTNMHSPTNSKIMNTKKIKKYTNKFITKYIVETDIWSRDISLGGVESADAEEDCLAINCLCAVSSTHLLYPFEA